MTTSSSLLVLGALGALSAAAGHAMAAVDTSQWKCESCPFEKKAISGTLDLGLGAVSDTSARFGDFTGLNRKRAFLIAGGDVRYHGDAGLFGSLTASDLGLDARALAAEVGQEGRYTLRLGYAEIPRHLSDTAMTPFLGSGGAVLSLPAGFPADTTAAMPLASTLQSADLGFKRTRYDLGASFIGNENWTYRATLRHDVRDGTQRTAGSFFADTSQLVAPVDQVTDQLEVAATYAGRSWQATLAYYASIFRNGEESLTWSNPFTNGAINSGSGQLALAPDNQFHQVQASVGYAISPQVRASAEMAIGRMTQDAAYLAATLNPSLAVPGLPALSLHGRAATLNASVRLTAAPTDRVRINASYTRDERDNETPSASYPSVSTDMFVGLPRSNQPFSFTQDKLKLSAAYRGAGSLRAAVGAEYDTWHRTLQETGATREATLWGRIGVRPRENLSLALRLSHAERDNSGYSPAPWIDPAENPLLRKYNLAERTRDTAGLRADVAVGESVNVGIRVDAAADDYTESMIGLIDGRSIGFGGDVSVAVSDDTQLHLFAQGERVRSRQDGSQLAAQPDWSGRSKDAFHVVGVGVKHAALKGKLEIGADLVASRSRSDVTVDTGASSPLFPTATTSLDSLKLHATYRVDDKLSLTGSFWHERYEAQDWRLDGVLPATVPNLLAFGEQPPRYRINLLGLALRYRF